MDEKITSYLALAALAADWAAGHFPLTVVTGRPGIGKTFAFEQAAGKGTIVIRGRCSSAALFMELAERPEAPVLVDDVDTVLADGASLSLLKAACDSRPEREIAWRVNGKRLTAMISGPIAILTNDIGSLNAHLSAVLSRAWTVEFMPPTGEVHAAAAAWADPEVHEFVGANLALLIDIDLRDYYFAQKARAAGRNWRQMLIGRWEHREVSLPPDEAERRRHWMKYIRAQYGEEGEGLTGREAVRKFAELGGGSRATYHRVQEDVREVLGIKQKLPRGRSVGKTTSADLIRTAATVSSGPAIAPGCTADQSSSTATCAEVAA